MDEKFYEMLWNWLIGFLEPGDRRHNHNQRTLLLIGSIAAAPNPYKITLEPALLRRFIAAQKRYRLKSGASRIRLST